MITKFRSRKNRKKTQPGTIGAPFLGSYGWFVASGSPSEGYLQLVAMIVTKNPSNPIVNVPIGDTGKIYADSVVQIIQSGILMPITQAELIGESQLYLTFPAIIGSCTVWIAASPEFTSLDGFMSSPYGQSWP